MRLTDRGIGLIGGAGALWLASRGFGVAELQIAAVSALGLLTLAVVYTRLSSAQLSVDRSIRPGRLFHDAEAHLTLVVHNRSRMPTAHLDLQDQAPPALASRGARMLVGSLPPLASRTLAYQLRGHHRGRFSIGPLTARMRDPFGLVSRQIELPGTSDLVVYPRVWALPEGAPLGGTTSGGSGRTQPLAGGEDLAHVREYVRGDDLRKVHWPTTAHRGKLMIRQPEAPKDPRAAVLLDVRAQAHRGVGPASSLETAISAAASVVHHLAMHRRGVALVDRPLETAPPVATWDAHLAYLAELEAARVDFPAICRQLGRGLAGEGLLVAVVAVPTPGELRALVRAGRAHSPRLAVLVDTHSHLGRGQRTPHANATADALRVAGWRVTVLAAGDHLGERWRELVFHGRRMPAGAAR